MTESKIIITYYLHSGFSVHTNETLLVFDYWRGEHGELPEERQITEEFIKSFKKVFVFTTHEHPDHADKIVHEWRNWGDVTYIVHDKMPIGVRGKRIGVGGQITLSEHVTVRAYDSTDLGVSYFVDLDGHGIFHAGDLNFWHWRNESTLKQIEREESEFIRKTAPIANEKIDLAFFPMDPRQGDMSDAGANYFIMTVKPRVLVPMHFWHYVDEVKDFARKNRDGSTRVIALTLPGEELEMVYHENGSIEVSTYNPVEIARPVQLEEQPLGDKQVHLEEYNGQDPFDESDLPINFDE